MNSKNLDYALSSLKSLEPSLTTELRKDAISSGWPANLANYLSVIVSGDSLLVQYDDSVAEQIEDLEYGTGSQSPKPVMRKFVYKHETTLSNVIAEASVDHLFDTEVLP